MKRYWKEFIKGNNLFKTIYCGGCKQNKVCGKLDQSFCCSCQFQIEQVKAEEYLTYNQA